MKPVRSMQEILFTVAGGPFACKETFFDGLKKSLSELTAQQREFLAQQTTFLKTTLNPAVEKLRLSQSQQHQQTQQGSPKPFSEYYVEVA